MEYWSDGGASSSAGLYQYSTTPSFHHSLKVME